MGADVGSHVTGVNVTASAHHGDDVRSCEPTDENDQRGPTLHNNAITSNDGKHLNLSTYSTHFVFPKIIFDAMI